MLESLTICDLLLTLAFSEPVVSEIRCADTLLAPALETLPASSPFPFLAQWVAGAAEQYGLAEDLAWLATMARLSLTTAATYHRHHIDEPIFWDTLSDLVIWQRNYLHKTGRIGIDQQAWLYGHISFQLFRLGRLQFHPFVISDRQAYDYDGASSLAVHIPQGEPLTPAACDASFERATEFWKGKFTCFFCESWLLDPDLQKVLPPQSNILMFQNRFSVYKVDKENKQMRERVLEMACGPETSLQKRIRHALSEGTVFGVGFGIFPFESH